MIKPEPPLVRFHEDADLMREAVNFTAAETGFVPRLIEKDYFCTVLLQHLAIAGYSLVFKGETCLAKVHAGLYRLSEDLDYVISTPLTATRAERSRLVAGLKEVIAKIDRQVSGFGVISRLTGANNSTQYKALISYTSVLGLQDETIKIEIGLREPLLRPWIIGAAQTLLLDPLSGEPMVPALGVPAISWTEAMAEKFRAALSRREVAIRDFYDIDYAVRRLNFSPHDPELVELVRRKLAVPGNEPADVSQGRLSTLRLQLDSQLKPVLRARDFGEFDLDRAFATVAEVAAAVGSLP